MLPRLVKSNGFLGASPDLGKTRLLSRGKANGRGGMRWGRAHPTASVYSLDY